MHRATRAAGARRDRCRPAAREFAMLAITVWLARRVQHKLNGSLRFRFRFSLINIPQHVSRAWRITALLERTELAVLVRRLAQDHAKVRGLTFMCCCEY